MNQAIEKYYTVNEVAEILQLGKSTVREMAETGSLPMFKIGRSWRIRESVLKDWLIRKENQENGKCIRKIPEEMVLESTSRRKENPQICRSHKIGSDGRFARL